MVCAPCHSRSLVRSLGRRINRKARQCCAPVQMHVLTGRRKIRVGSLATITRSCRLEGIPVQRISCTDPIFGSNAQGAATAHRPTNPRQGVGGSLSYRSCANRDCRCGVFWANQHSPVRLLICRARPGWLIKQPLLAVNCASTTNTREAQLWPPPLDRRFSRYITGITTIAANRPGGPLGSE